MIPAADHLAHLIRIPSVSSSSNRPIIDYARHALHHSGWTTHQTSYRDTSGVEKINLIAAPPHQDPTRQHIDLALVCHTDTVPYAPDWSSALTPTITADHLHGCGACDVKGFLACLLEAAAPPPHATQTTRWLDGLRIVLTADEEIGCLGAKHLIDHHVIQPRRMVIGEPTSLRVARAGKGYCLTEVVIHGVEAHSAHPEQGASAIFAASHFIRSIETLAHQLQAHTHNLFTPPYTSLNVGTIHGGTAKNIIPGQCRFLVEWRPIPALPPNLIPGQLQAFADQLHHRDPRLTCSIQHLRQQSGFETPASAPLVQSLLQASARPATAIPFGSEASIFAAIAEQVVVFGPGDMRTAHSDRECVPLAELSEAVHILTSLMTQS